jgi:spore coat protein A, manganese oxidase
LQNGGGGWDHPIHIHLLNFQILDRNGKRAQPWEQQTNAWKETVHLAGNDVVRVIMHWPEVPPDALGRAPGTYKNRYVFHCHNLEHEDMMMMANFEVV